MNEHRKRAARENMQPAEPNHNWSHSDWFRTYGMIIFNKRAQAELTLVENYF